MNTSERRNITPDMTVLDVVSAHAGTIDVFKRYDAAAGECICCNALFMTVGSVADRYGLDLGALLSDLEAAV